MKAKVYITLKNGVLDPQGAAIESTLGHMGFTGISGVRVGKYIELDLQEADEAQAKARAEQMCSRLLANTVIEKFHVELAD